MKPTKKIKMGQTIAHFWSCNFRPNDEQVEVANYLWKFQETKNKQNQYITTIMENTKCQAYTSHPCLLRKIKCQKLTSSRENTIEGLQDNRSKLQIN
jgi:hypothetical protein